MLGDDNAKELVNILHDLKKEMANFRERRGTSQIVSQHINAGGHAVWIVIVMAAIIFTAAVLQGPRISNLERRVDRLEDYISAIYQQVPGLKEQIEKNVNDHNHHEAADQESDTDTGRRK